MLIATSNALLKRHRGGGVGKWGIAGATADDDHGLSGGTGNVPAYRTGACPALQLSDRDRAGPDMFRVIRKTRRR